MKRKDFLCSVFSGAVVGLCGGHREYEEEYVKALIYNDNGSQVLKAFEEIKWADYFQLVNPDGSLKNSGEVFLATSNPYIKKDGLYKGEWTINICESVNPNKIISVNNNA